MVAEVPVDDKRRGLGMRTTIRSLLRMIPCVGCSARVKSCHWKHPILLVSCVSQAFGRHLAGRPRWQGADLSCILRDPV